MKKLLFTLGIVSASLFSAQTNVTFDFEAPAYNLGPLGGQNGWGNTQVATGSTVVTSELANPGVQSIKQTGNNTSGTASTNGGVVSGKVNIAAPIVTFMFNAHMLPSTPAGNESDFFISAQSPDQSTIVGRMRLSFDNKIYVVDQDPATLQLVYVDTNATYTKSTWSTYRMQIDFANGVIDYYKDNALIYSGGVVGGTQVGNVAITNDNYNSASYFDGISYFAGAMSVQEMTKVSYKLYPNPTTDVINVSVDSKIKSAAIYDMSGKMLKIKFVNGAANISDLAPGVYTVQLETEAGKIVDRFIKK